MKAKDIYIIRHGETEYNKLGMVQGSGIDANLNDLGKAQAQAFYEHFFHIPFDKVYTSRLKRTHQSVNGFINELNLPWQQLYGLNEISWGAKEGRILTDEDDRSYYEMVAGWRKGETFRKPVNGESPEDVQVRQRTAWRYIMENREEKNVLICMHGRAIRILMCLLMETPLSEMDCYKHENLCLYHLRFENGSYQIVKQNYTGHLAKISSNKPEEVYAGKQ